MADDAAGSSEEQSISFNIKTSGDDKFSVTVPLSTTVLALKELLSSDNYASLPVERQRLIYSGRVLKDADTLATYKIKEGNTVHLVKGAESNVRNQQPASQAGVAGSGSGGTGTGSGNLPSMATGTGANNLLAGLTGARFAGLAQLPNQSMFGPDGGMGPPPDPEEQLRLLDNPAMRQQMNEMLDNPAVLDEMIRQNPMLANMPGARQMLQSPMFRNMMTDPNHLRQVIAMQRAMGQGQGAQSSFAAPGGVEGGDTTDTLATGQTQGQAGQPAAPPNPFANLFGAPGAAGGAGGAGGMADNPFTALLNPAMFGAPPAAGSGTAGADGQAGDGANRSAAGSPPAQNPFGNPFGNQMGNPMMQNMTRNLMQNPELMGQLMQAMYGTPGQGGTNNTAGAGSGAGAETGQAGGGAEGAGQSGQPANPFAALFGGGGGGGQGGAQNPFAAFGDFGGTFGVPPAGPPDNRPPEERYAEQLRQLNDMGFYEFERNIEALRRSGGSVQGAVNYLLGG